MRNVLHDLVSLFYPNLCLLCGSPLVEKESHICMDCICDLPKTNYHLNKGNPARSLFSGYPQVNEVSAFLFFEKDGTTQKLIHNIKYQGNKPLAEQIGRMAAIELKNDGFYASADTIIPVPLHPRKEKRRGYNQSECIAQGISRIYGCAVDTSLLRRKSDTASQTRKTVYERHVNVEKNFEVTDPELLFGKHILLVDDVLTTGATITSCIEALITIPEILISIFSLSIAREY